MKLRFASAALALLIPLAGVAQGIAPVAPVQSDHFIAQLLSMDAGAGDISANQQVVPVWASPDGRLLAVVALSRETGVPTLPLAPQVGSVVDWRIIDATNLLSGGMRFQIGNGFHLQALAGSSSANPSCTLSRTCSSLELGSLSSDHLFAGNLGLGWTSAGGNFDVSYGLSWLRGQYVPSALESDSVGAAAGLPSLVVPNQAAYRLDSSAMLGAQARWRTGFGPVIDIAASYGQSHLAPLGYQVLTPGVTVDQSTLTLGVSSGSLRGSVVGHVLSSDDPAQLNSKRWGGIDLGVSWRTPWQGVLSIGAQNIWSTPLDSSARETTDPASNRTPYVQYRQDL